MSSPTTPQLASAETSAMPKKLPPSPGISADDPLASHLSSLLPAILSLKLYHISTPPSRHFPLFSSPPGQDPHRTSLESHFLVLSHGDVLVFAIEVLIYTIPSNTPARSSSRKPIAAATFLQMSPRLLLKRGSESLRCAPFRLLSLNTFLTPRGGRIRT